MNAAILLGSFLVLGCVAQYVTQKANIPEEPIYGPGLSYKREIRPYNGYNISAYFAYVSNPIGHFYVLYPELQNGSCGGYLYPSKRAQQVGCLYATNGGPFVMGVKPPFNSPTCLGNVVANSTVAQTQSTTNVNFGLTASGEFVMGVLQPSDVSSLNFTQLLTGFGWLVYEGKNNVTTPGGEIAPRTAIAADYFGRLIIFEADGAEDMPNGKPKGLTLQQTAQWMADLGAYYAVNLDGGGSSVTVVKGSIVDFPTCHDVDVKCERAVTTMTCIM